MTAPPPNPETQANGHVRLDYLDRYHENLLRRHLQRAQVPSNWLGTDVDALILTDKLGSFVAIVPLAAEPGSAPETYAVGSGLANARAWLVLVPESTHAHQHELLVSSAQRAVEDLSVRRLPCVIMYLKSSTK